MALEILYDETLAVLDGDINKILTSEETVKIKNIVKKMVDCKDFILYDHNLLFSACRRNDCEFAKYLLDHGADPNIIIDGEYPLQIPAIEGVVDIFDLFLKYNVNFNIQNDEGDSLLHFACTNGKFDIVKILLSQNAGANINSRSLSGETSMYDAISWGRVPEILDLLYFNGADIEDISNNGNTLLMFACFFGNYEGVSKLISYGCDLDAQNNEGDTALMFSIDNLEITEILVKNECNINIKNNKGETALDLNQKLSDFDDDDVQWFNPEKTSTVFNFLKSL